MIILVETNKDGKIELTKEELDKMLKDAYAEGKADEKRIHDSSITISSPYDTYQPSKNWVYYGTADTPMTYKDKGYISETNTSIQ